MNWLPYLMLEACLRPLINNALVVLKTILIVFTMTSWHELDPVDVKMLVQALNLGIKRQSLNIQDAKIVYPNFDFI